ncbi:MAG: succinate dehydrogenase/fumarate reductase iron-sulfur subunit [Candidatus Thorarchaeota archaeon]
MQNKSQLHKAKLIIQRGETKEAIRMEEFDVDLEPGSVVLDAVHAVQALHAKDLAVRWNCKAGKCGSCSAEINGLPKLMCMTRLSDYDPTEPIIVKPMAAFPLIKDLVTDVSWNYEVNRKIPPLAFPEIKKPRIMQEDVDRIQEFRKCIECYLCQDVCHVLRTHQKFEEFVGPRFLLRLANLDMHPLDIEDRAAAVKNEFGIGYCNITKCCTEVCPENIQITDNAIIPLKERVADRYYDPIKWIWRKIFGFKRENKLLSRQ